MTITRYVRRRIRKAQFGPEPRKDIVDYYYDNERDASYWTNDVTHAEQYLDKEEAIRAHELYSEYAKGIDADADTRFEIVAIAIKVLGVVA